MTEIIYFDTKVSEDKDVYKNTKYNLLKSYSSKEEFDLTLNSHVFFKASEKDRNFIFEVFKSRYLLISFVPLPNNASSPYNLVREKIYLYDMESQKLYFFVTKNFLLSPMRNKTPIMQNKEQNYHINATINDIFINENEVVLLLSDLKTLEKIKLNQVKNNIVLE